MITANRFCAFCLPPRLPKMVPPPNQIYWHQETPHHPAIESICTMRVRVNPYQSHQVPSRFTTFKTKWQPYWSNSNRISASVSSAQRPLSCKLFSSDFFKPPKLDAGQSEDPQISGPSSPSGGHHGWWRSMKWSKKMVAPTHVKQKRLLNIFPPLVRVTIQFEICETKACHLHLEINPYQFVYGRAFYHYTYPWWAEVLHQHLSPEPLRTFLGSLFSYAKLWDFGCHEGNEFKSSKSKFLCPDPPCFESHSMAPHLANKFQHET